VILPVDYAGHPAALDDVRALAKRHGLIVIEDACHALGAVYRNRRVGSISDMTVFSFHPVKHITTGEGGMVVTNHDRLANRLRRFRNHGIVRNPNDFTSRPWYYEMTELGYNYRIPDILCALGRSQFSRIAQNLARRRAIAARYSDALGGMPGIRIPPVKPEVTPAWHLYPIRIDSAVAGVSRDELIRRLRQERIGSTVHYIPVTLHPYYRRQFGYRRGDYPVTERASRSLISLPLFHSMTDDDASDVIHALTRLLSRSARRHRRPPRAAALVHGSIR